MKSLRKSLMAIVAMVMVLLVIPATKTEAATNEDASTYTYVDGNQTLKLSIKRGVATLTINDGETYQLTRMYVAEDGGFDSYGNIYLVYYSKNIYACNYQLQGKNIVPKVLGFDILTLVKDSNKMVLGYETLDGLKNALTIEQMKDFLNNDKQDNNKEDNNKQDNDKQDNNKQDNNKEDNNKQDNDKQDNNKQDNNKEDNNKQETKKGIRCEGNTVIYTDDNNKQYILSSGISVESVAIDSLKTVYIRFTDGSIKYWNYQLQKDKVYIELQELTKNSKGLVINSEENVVAWYDATGKIQELLTIEKINSILNPPTTIDIPQIQKEVKCEGNTVIYTDTNNKQYILSSNGTVDKAAVDNLKTVYIRYSDGSIKYWNYQLQKDDSNIKLHELTSKSNSLLINSEEQAVAWYDSEGNLRELLTIEKIKEILNSSTNTTKIQKGIKCEGNVVIFTDDNNKQYILSSNSSVDKVAIDNIDTVYIRYSEGDIKYWNYKLQKEEITINLHELAGKSSSLLVNSDNQAVAWYDSTGKMQKLLSIEEINLVLHPVNSNTSTNNTTTQKKVVRNYRSVPKGEYMELHNSKDQRVDYFKLTNEGKFSYHGIVIKNVKVAQFNEKGNVILVTNKGKNIVINHVSLKRKTIKKSGVSKLSYTNRGLAKYAVKKNRTRYKVNKF